MHEVEQNSWSHMITRDSGDFETWERAISQSHLDWTLRSQTGAFKGALLRHRLGSARVVQCSCGPLAGERGKRQIAQSEDS